MSHHTPLPAAALAVVLALAAPPGARAHDPAHATQGGKALAHALAVVQQQQLAQQLALLNLEAARQQDFLRQESVRQRRLLEQQVAQQRALAQDRLERQQALERFLRGP